MRNFVVKSAPRTCATCFFHVSSSLCRISQYRWLCLARIAALFSFAFAAACVARSASRLCWRRFLPAPLSCATSWLRATYASSCAAAVRTLSFPPRAPACCFFAAFSWSIARFFVR